MTLALAKRAVLGIVRSPAMVVPGLLFPLFFAALFTAGFQRGTNLPGFPPVDSFLDFILATTILQGLLFGALNGGSALAIDIETGFFDRLVASPVPRLSILLGRMGGAVTFGVAQALVFTTVFVVFGVSIKSGALGFAVLVVTAALLALGIGGLAMAMALRTGSSEAVQGAFPLFFVLMFTSSAFFPRQLMTGWYQSLADVNPISYLVEGMRAMVISSFDAADALQAIGIAAAIVLVTFALATRALRHRVAGL